MMRMPDLGVFSLGDPQLIRGLKHFKLITSSQGWSWMVDNFFLKIYVTSVYLMTQIQFMLIAFGFVSCLF